MALKKWLIGLFFSGKLPLWVYRMIGKKLAKKLNFEGDIMPEETIKSKPWYQSKAVWSAIIMAFVGGIQPISAALNHPIAIPLWIIEVLTGLGLYGIRTADSKIQ